MKVGGHFSHWAIAFLSLVPFYMIGMVVGLFDKNRGLRFINIWNRLFLALFHIEVRIDTQKLHRPPSQKAVFILLNQTSLLEAQVMSVQLPYQRVVVNIEYSIIPFIGWSHWIFGWVIIRQWPRQAKKKMGKVKRFVENGGSVWMSIEGRRSHDGKLSPYKKGPVVLAIQAKADIVPVFIHGAWECLPYGEWRIRPGVVRIKFFEPISTRCLTYGDREKIISQMHLLAEREMEHASCK